MDKLKGTGNTFSTSGKGWHPFPGFNRNVIKRAAKLHRLKAKGMLPPTDKASLRLAGQHAIGLREPKAFPDTEQ